MPMERLPSFFRLVFHKFSTDFLHFPYKSFVESLSKFTSPFLMLLALIRLCAFGVYDARVKCALTTLKPLLPYPLHA